MQWSGIVPSDFIRKRIYAFYDRLQFKKVLNSLYFQSSKNTFIFCYEQILHVLFKVIFGLI